MTQTIEFLEAPAADGQLQELIAHHRAAIAQAFALPHWATVGDASAREQHHQRAQLATRHLELQLEKLITVEAERISRGTMRCLKLPPPLPPSE